MNANDEADRTVRLTIEIPYHGKARHGFDVAKAAASSVWVSMHGRAKVWINDSKDDTPMTELKRDG